MPKPSRLAARRTPRAAEVVLPHRFVPRSYQLPVLRALEMGRRRAVCVWHRKAGKDLVALNWTIMQMLKRPGLYLHLFPDSVQGRRVLWDGISAGGSLDGVPLLDHFPPEIVLEKNETEMLVRTLSSNGGTSVFQVVGTDRPDRLRGPNMVGVTLSEYPYMDPDAWEVIAPVLAANGGWAVFAYTPCSRNHGLTLYQNALRDPAWFAEILSVDQTHKDAPGEDRTRVITPATLEAERARGVDEDFIHQEYFCSFEGSRVGSYYGDALRRAREQGRITQVPWDPSAPVECWVDLGLGPHLGMWLVQHVGPQVRVLRFYEGRGSDSIVELAKVLQTWPYTYSAHLWPHDAGQTEVGTGKTRQEIAEALGIQPIEVGKKINVEDGITAARALLERCWFDEEHCRRGLDCLAAYHRDWDDKGGTWRPKPDHDWASHAADAFRTGAVGTHGGMPLEAKPLTVITDFDPRETFAPWGMR